MKIWKTVGMTHLDGPISRQGWRRFYGASGRRTALIRRVTFATSSFGCEAACEMIRRSQANCRFGLDTDPDTVRRDGRSIPFSAEWRGRVLTALKHYEEWLDVGGFVDSAALSLEAHKYIDQLRSGGHPFKYSSILVDEMQDLGSVELEVIKFDLRRRL